MVQLQESGRYDTAVRVVEEWMNQHQNDASQNDFLHQQIAMVYISKAYRKQSTRDESIDKAASHLEQALNLDAAKKPEDIDTLSLRLEARTKFSETSRKRINASSTRRLGAHLKSSLR